MRNDARGVEKIWWKFVIVTAETFAQWRDFVFLWTYEKENCNIFNFNREKIWKIHFTNILWRKKHFSSLFLRKARKGKSFLLSTGNICAPEILFIVSIIFFRMVKNKYIWTWVSYLKISHLQASLFSLAVLHDVFAALLRIWMLSENCLLNFSSRNKNWFLEKTYCMKN